jgi:hypothetical protein
MANTLKVIVLRAFTGYNSDGEKVKTVAGQELAISEADYKLFKPFLEITAGKVKKGKAAAVAVSAETVPDEDEEAGSGADKDHS